MKTRKEKKIRFIVRNDDIAKLRFKQLKLALEIGRVAVVASFV